MSTNAYCVGCGCSDDNACMHDICWWRKVDYDAGIGVCSNCDTEENNQEYYHQLFSVKTPMILNKEYMTVNRREFLSNERHQEGRTE